jgi:adenylate kinase family enzyme
VPGDIITTRNAWGLRVGTPGHGSQGTESLFVRPFGLSDNPFSPARLPLLPDGTRPSVAKLSLSNINTRPLRVDKEPNLRHLVVPGAGDFAAFEREFRNKLEVAGYAAHPVETANHLAFIISGAEGTGKSTLASMLVRRLQLCKATWSPVYYSVQTPGTFGRSLYKYLAEKLDETPEDGYCYLVVDDLTAGNKDDAIKIFEEYSSSRILIMFMVTSDIQLLQEADENYRIELKRFRTESLTPDQAVAFVRHRIAQYREPRLREVLAEYPLFPFLEEDIRWDVAESRKDPNVGRGSITLRSLATILNRTLELHFPIRRNGPDLAMLSANEIASRIIKPSQTYANLPEVAA